MPPRSRLANFPRPLCSSSPSDPRAQTRRAATPAPMRLLCQSPAYYGADSGPLLLSGFPGRIGRRNSHDSARPARPVPRHRHRLPASTKPPADCHAEGRGRAGHGIQLAKRFRRQHMPAVPVPLLGERVLRPDVPHRDTQVAACARDASQAARSMQDVMLVHETADRRTAAAIGRGSWAAVAFAVHPAVDGLASPTAWDL